MMVDPDIADAEAIGDTTFQNPKQSGSVFPCIPGEQVRKISNSKCLTIALTNLRLAVLVQSSFFNLPLLLIDYVEHKDLISLIIYCKDARCFKVEFESTDACSEWWKEITGAVAFVDSIQSLFALSCDDGRVCNGDQPYKAQPAESTDYYVMEIKRLGFNTDTIWRTAEINSKFGLCHSYPKLHLVPSWITDDELRSVANFRSMRRFPSVVWRHATNGSVLVRSSQPEVGWLGWRCREDEKLLRSIAEAAALDSMPSVCHMTASVANLDLIPRKFLVVDARSYTAAVANRAKGGGVEFQEYYDNCDVKFMGLTNIHGIRRSFHSLRALVLLGQDQPNWLSSLEATKWLHYISSLLRSALVVVDTLERDACSVLVHCSDGWDRTAQIVAMTELMLDPYYRTMAGFKVLVQREWIDFGHKFSDRCGHLGNLSDINERCPVFLQWLDCVHQLTRQFPTAFEFNELYLVKLARQVYCGTFGTFLCNQPKERIDLKIGSQTPCLWAWFEANRQRMVNYLYCKADVVLRPLFHVRCLFFWDSVYVPASQLISCNPGHDKDMPCPYDRTPAAAVVRNASDQTSDIDPTTSNGLDREANREEEVSTSEDIAAVHDMNSSCSSSVHTLTDSVVSTCAANTPAIMRTSQCRVLEPPSATASPSSLPKMHGHRRTQSSGSVHSTRTARRNSLTDALDVSRQQQQQLHGTADPLARDNSLVHARDLHELLLPHLDSDGLVKLTDPVQERIHLMKCEHYHEVARLQRCIEIEKTRRLLAAKHHDNGGPVENWKLSEAFDDVLSLPGSSAGERASLSSISNEEGWEQVQYDDVQPTKWVPDHVAAHCDKCGALFGMVIRRHHCRKCGHVFCSSCSDRCLPLPDEQLYDPVRVCRHCYERMT